jgi:hypothetical protein
MREPASYLKFDSKAACKVINRCRSPFHGKRDSHNVGRLTYKRLKPHFQTRKFRLGFGKENISNNKALSGLFLKTPSIEKGGVVFAETF